MKKAVFVAALALAVAVVGTAVAAFPDDNVKLYTGCLNSGGAITYVKEGDSPLQACASPKQVVKLSGGDITSVNTPAGSGLAGGSTNGAVTLSLDAAHSLPTGCSSGQVAKSTGSNAWNCGNDNDHTYSADGTTLNLSSGTFSVDPDYRVKNTPDCSSGQFATGFDGDGDIECGAPPATSMQAFFGRQTNPTQGGVADDDVGIPDDDENRVYASVNVPAGTYLVLAKGRVDSEHNAETNLSGFSSCSIPDSSAPDFQIGGDDYTLFVPSQVNDEGFDGTFSLMTTVPASSSRTIALLCRARSAGGNGLSLHQARIVALKIG